MKGPLCGSALRRFRAGFGETYPSALARKPQPQTLQMRAARHPRSDARKCIRRFGRASREGVFRDGSVNRKNGRPAGLFRVEISETVVAWMSLPEGESHGWAGIVGSARAGCHSGASADEEKGVPTPRTRRADRSNRRIPHAAPQTVTAYRFRPRQAGGANVDMKEKANPVPYAKNKKERALSTS